jgi:hypothetical protein
MRAVNNFSGGPDGTTVTTSNSGQYGDNAFNSTNSSGNTLQFASVALNNLNRPTAEYTLRMQTGSSAFNPYVMWSSATLGTQSQMWTRFYAYFSTVATNSTNLCLMWFSSGGSIDTSSLWLRTSATPYYLYVQASNSAGATQTMMSTPLGTSQWIRVEFTSTPSQSYSGINDLYLYQGNDTDTSNYTDHVTQTGLFTSSTTFDTMQLGQSTNFGGGQANTPAVYFSNLEVNNTGFPGPAPFRQGQGSPPGNLTNPIAYHMI